MKNINITLQPLSLLVGAALVGLSLVTSGAFTPQGSSGARDVSAIQILGQPRPQEMMRVTEGAAFTVPPNKLFVVTGLLSTYAVAPSDGDNIVTLAFDGQDIAAALLSGARRGSASPGGSQENSSSHTVSPYGGGPSLASVPPGLVATAGQVVTVIDNTSGVGTALGYLVDA
jgi:hypothetical protein